VEYIFKHALTQEVAYGTVLHERRKRLHERTGQALEALYVATLHEHYDDLYSFFMMTGHSLSVSQRGDRRSRSTSGRR
jgi:hypothetical protein